MKGKRRRNRRHTYRIRDNVPSGWARPPKPEPIETIFVSGRAVNRKLPPHTFAGAVLALQKSKDSATMQSSKL